MEILFRCRHVQSFLNGINHRFLTETHSNSIASCNHVWLGRFVAENEVRASNLADLLLPQVFRHVLAHNTLRFLLGVNVLSVTLDDICCHLLN